MTNTPTVRTAPAPVALVPVYVAKNFATGDQFIIYAPAPGGETGIFTVTHVRGTPTGIATPIVCQVPVEDLAPYAAGAVRILRARNTGSPVIVCTNTAPWPLAAALPR